MHTNASMCKSQCQRCSSFQIFGIFYKNPKLIAEVIDSEVFLATGDIGYRCWSKEQCLINGRENWVYPLEIEVILLKWPDVKDVFVLFHLIKSTYEAAGTANYWSRCFQCKKFFFNFFGFFSLTDNLPIGCKLDRGVYFVNSIARSVIGKPLHRDVKELTAKWFND